MLLSSVSGFFHSTPGDPSMGFCTAVVHSHCCVVFHCMNKPHFVPPTGGGHLGCFSLMALL